MTTITITRPDDWHTHLRDGEVLKDTVRDISQYMGTGQLLCRIWFHRLPILTQH